MRKITMTLAAAALVLGSLAVANAQTQGASRLNAQAQNATMIHKAACGGLGLLVSARTPACLQRLGPVLVRSLLVSRIAIVTCVDHGRRFTTTREEDLMRKITLTLAAAALVFGSLAVANAQTQGASTFTGKRRMQPRSSTLRPAGMGSLPPRRFWACGPIAASAAPVDEHSATTENRFRPPPGCLAFDVHSSSTTTPSRMVTRRSICAAMSRLWVAMMAARPEARTN